MRREVWTIKSIVSGEVVGQFVVEADPVRDEPKAAPPYIPPDRPNDKPNDKPNGQEQMTEPQRRYLFRLLGAQKITGKDAERHLKEYVRVTALANVSKGAASEYINQLVKDKADAHA